MLSLELVKRLKELGLEWEPQRGDWYYNHHGYVSGTTTTLDLLNEVTVLIQSISRDYANRTVHFAPRLDQLLWEIEKRGYKWDLTNCPLEPLGKYSLTLWIDNGLPNEHFADSPEEAAAQALIWILEQEGANWSTTHHLAP